MKNKDFQKLKKLLKKGDITEDEDCELEELLNLRKLEQQLAYPTPQCCQDAMKYPVISFAVKYTSGDTSKNKGEWYIKTLDKIIDHHSTKDWLKWNDNRPEPKVCPYCSTSLPKMKRKKPVPKDVCRVTDGGYYCDTCEKRLNCCICLPHEFAWEPAQ